MSLTACLDGFGCEHSPYKGTSHGLQPLEPYSQGFRKLGWNGQNKFVQRLNRTGGSHCLEIYLCVPETCRTKTYTWLFWQEQEGLDYPFPPRESGHLRCACWRSICFSTNRASARPPRGLHGRHSSSNGRAAAVSAHVVKGSGSPFHLSISKLTVATGCALMGSAPFSSPQRLWNIHWGHILPPEMLFLERAFGKWQNKNIQCEPSTSFMRWVPEVMELDLGVYAGCVTAFRIWSPGVWFAPESKMQILVTGESRADSPHLPLFHDLTLWCTMSRSNFICRSSLATIKQKDTFRKKGFCYRIIENQCA